MTTHFDWIIVGSGFGGSVSALRLAEKGHRVLVLEKGRRFSKDDFAKSNWDLPNWMWKPALGMRGIFQMSFFRHITILHGVGVGGGSLTYANTLPTPKDGFFEAESWAHLGDWKADLAPHYDTALRMLGATQYPRTTLGDEVLSGIAEDVGRADSFEAARLGVFFGEAGEEVPDPYFDGEGPARTGCTDCGACMTGCRVGAKNTLDRNYLHLAEGLGVEVRSGTEVVALRAVDGGGYRVETKAAYGPRNEQAFTADKVILAAGVMGTLPLLLRMKEDPQGLPRLSDRLGKDVRTNSEALFGVVAPDPELDFSRGPAITSILHTDDHSHIEPVRYAAGSGFFRTMALPLSPGSNAVTRVAGAAGMLLRSPWAWTRALTVGDWAKQSQVLLYMRTLEGTLTLKLGRDVFTGFRRGLVTELDDPENPPQAFMPEAMELGERFAEKVGGVLMTLAPETLLGNPTTAHILGGCCMGTSEDDGVIDANHAAFGYDGLYVIDGSAVSANPGVNPSLTITALAERAMAAIA